MAICIWLPDAPAAAQEHLPQLPHNPLDADPKSVGPLKWFQKFISPADGDRCPMHPSCSRYAGQAVSRHGIFKGWILASDRLMRCGRDETRRAAPILVKGQRLTFDPLDANTFWWNK
ncbi:MAG: membrane protein insertion efficiency factor YidD [Desulfatitalea sp.]|nr:membrane protein insertion efficiency factor YidD [Desulfatitalea sp.]